MRTTSRCLACDRPVLNADACPYCGEAISGAARPTWAQTLTIGIALAAGLFLLGHARVAYPIPVSVAAGVDRLPDHTLIHLQGVVSEGAVVRGAAGPDAFLSFELVDASGAARIVAEGRVARAILRRDGPPCGPQTLDVRGLTECRDGASPHVRIVDPSHLTSASGP